LFDQIVFSRGRFLVRVAGGGDLVLPTWPEPARLIEECRELGFIAAISDSSVDPSD
jgi:hypothetical protein